MKIIYLYLLLNIAFSDSYVLQVSAWSNLNDAEIELSRIKNLELNGFIEKHEIHGNSIWRVRVGSFQKYVDMDIPKKLITEHLGVKPWIIKIPTVTDNVTNEQPQALESKQIPSNSKDDDLLVELKEDLETKLYKANIEKHETDSLVYDTSLITLLNDKPILNNMSGIRDVPNRDEFIYFDTAPLSKPGYEIKPIYPTDDKRLGNEGNVIVKCFVDKYGMPSDPFILKGSGLESLDDAAIQSILKSEWIPAKVKDVSIGVWQTTTIKFKI